MKTILIFVTSLDGKITKWGDPFVKLWSSKEDQQYFEKNWHEFKLLIMGSRTFDADPILPSSKHLLVIMTGKPEKYKDFHFPGQLEFLNEAPAQLVTRFENEGFGQMLVVGGARIATSFLKSGLIDEIWLTLEPRIFGSGGSFVIEDQLNIELRLLSYEKVNDQGTLITKYAVLKKEQP